MELKDLEHYAGLAKNILESGTQYQSNKEFINTLFEKPSNKEDEHHKRTLRTRIIVIDSCYSTNVGNFTSYGIRDLVHTLAKYSDTDLIKHADDFLTTSGDEEIKKLLDKKYGIDKAGEGGGKRPSFVSKYLYFLRGCDFPIYDSLAKKSYKNLKNRGLSEVMLAIKSDDSNYFECMTKLNTETGIKDYGTLDNLLWLMGKTLDGSFNFMKKEDYLKLVEWVGKDNLRKAEKKDDFIRNHMKHNKGSGLFTEEQENFFKFVFELNDK